MVRLVTTHGRTLVTVRGRVESFGMRPSSPMDDSFRPGNYLVRKGGTVVRVNGVLPEYHSYLGKDRLPCTSPLTTPPSLPRMRD